MKIFKYIKKLFSKSKKTCIECNHFRSLNDGISPMAYGLCKEIKENKIAVYKNDKKGCKKFEIKDPVKKDPYAPRVRNKIYPNDEFGIAHMEKWLDDVYWKHHG